ncbi:MAG: hypothetical protein DHS20C13_04880 [Thermodesulfobacteriota bacterium]|nr:MAG: hypothetical protein DHS20C13_04880 [Thermodesulfobacteriota bacterium]
MKLSLVALLVFSFLSLSFMTLKDVNDADELYARINELNYKQFARAPGFEERTLAIQHNEGDQDMYVDIYMNEVLEKVLEANDPIEQWPVGSLFVKEAYRDEEFMHILASEKLEDGWVFMQWRTDGVAEFAGKPQVCLNCHMKGDDMVRAFRFPQYQKSK